MSEKNPDVLYHYCSAEVFGKIMEALAIRLSLLTLSNDSSEGSLFKEILSDISRSRGHKESNFEFGYELYGSSLQHRSAFGFCLSTKRDWLGQWRGYADDGRGFCIGFNAESLRGCKLQIDGKHSFPELLECIYDRDQQHKIVSVAYDSIFEPGPNTLTTLAKAQPSVRSSLRYAATVQNFAENVSSDVYRLKHPAFEDENEFRLVTIVYQGAENSEYELTTRKIQSYFECRFEPEAIVNVTLGPKNNNSAQILKAYLKNRCGIMLTNDQVLRSKVPYR